MTAPERAMEVGSALAQDGATKVIDAAGEVIDRLAAFAEDTGGALEAVGGIALDNPGDLPGTIGESIPALAERSSPSWLRTMALVIVTAALVAMVVAAVAWVGRSRSSERLRRRADARISIDTAPSDSGSATGSEEDVLAGVTA